MCFLDKTVHVTTVPLEHRRTVNSEWYATIYLPKVLEEIRKTNKRSESLFNMTSLFTTTNRALTHRLKVAPYCLAKTHRIDGSAAVQPWLGRQWLLFIAAHRQKLLLKRRSKTMFWRCLNRSDKTNTNAGRASKHSEWHYAKKCQAFL